MNEDQRRDALRQADEELRRVAGATSVKMGSPNDEVLNGHPLWGSGLEFYEAHEVRNSPWISELMDINRVHSGFHAKNLHLHCAIDCVKDPANSRPPLPAIDYIIEIRESVLDRWQSVVAIATTKRHRSRKAIRETKSHGRFAPFVAQISERPARSAKHTRGRWPG